MKDFEAWYNDPATQEMLEFHGLTKEAAEFVWSAAKVSLIHSISTSLL